MADAAERPAWGIRVAQVGTVLVAASGAYLAMFWLVLTDHNLVHPFNFVMWMLGWGFLLGFGLGPLLAAGGWWWSRGTRWEWPTTGAVTVSGSLRVWLLLSPPLGI